VCLGETEDGVDRSRRAVGSEEAGDGDDQAVGVGCWRRVHDTIRA